VPSWRARKEKIFRGKRSSASARNAATAHARRQRPKTKHWPGTPTPEKRLRSTRTGFRSIPCDGSRRHEILQEPHGRLHQQRNKQRSNTRLLIHSPKRATSCTGVLQEAQSALASYAPPNTRLSEQRATQTFTCVLLEVQGSHHLTKCSDRICDGLQSRARPLAQHARNSWTRGAVLQPVYDRRHRRRDLKEEDCHKILEEAQGSPHRPMRRAVLQCEPSNCSQRVASSTEVLRKNCYRVRWSSCFKSGCKDSSQEAEINCLAQLRDQFINEPQ
jgi:hypothetical protein